jgi:hypothetical protein
VVESTGTVISIVMYREDGKEVESRNADWTYM